MTDGLSSGGDRSGRSRLELVRPPDGEPKPRIWSVAVYPIVRYRRLIVSAVVAAGVVTGTIVSLTPRTYRSTARVIPSARHGSGVDALSRLGLSLGHQVPLPPGMDVANGESALYVEILRSHHVRDHVLEHPYRIGELSDSTFDLYSLFQARTPERAYRRLNRITNVGRDGRTGVVSVTVQTIHPRLSAAIAEQFLAGLTAYNATQRKETLRRVEGYLEERLAASQVDLQRAEDDLAAFQAQNRNYSVGDDPELTKELRRLSRAVEIRTNLFLMLNQQHTLARIEAEKELPSVQILDAPQIATEHAGPRRVRMVLATMMLTGFLLAGVASLLSWIRLLLSPADLTELRSVVGVLRGDLRRVPSLFRSERRHAGVES